MLSEILNEIDQSPSTSTKKDVEPLIPRRKIVHNYMQKFCIKKAETPLLVTEESKQAVEEKENAQPPEDDVKSVEMKDENVKFSTQAEDDFGDDMDLSRIEELETQIHDEVLLKDLPEPEDPCAFAKELCTNNESQSMDFLARQENVSFELGEEEAFRFFWWDAFEDPESQRGTVFFFGKTYCKKTKAYLSCCVAVKNLNRRIFLLPRPCMLGEQDKPTETPVTFKDLYSEFSTLVAEAMQIKVFKARLVSKKYVFDQSVPRESDYLEVVYPATDPKINVDQLSRTPRTFSRIFGNDSSTLERFLLEAKIKGPCWLDIKQPVFNNNPLSWCKVEVNCSAMKNVVKVDETLPPPPLTVMTVNLRIDTHARSLQNEIFMASCVVQSNYFIDKQQPDPAFDKHFCGK